MDTQTLTPGSAGPFNSQPAGGPGRSGGGRSPLLPILVIILGLGTVVFGVLTVTFSSQASNATKVLTQAKITAAAGARDDQKKADEAAFIRANESPFRAYTAPAAFGSFVISFPKTWSSVVEQKPSGTQVALILNPDFIRKTNGQDEVMAMRVTLQESTKDQYLNAYSGNLKNGKLKQTATTVSGLPAIDLVGNFNGKKTVHEVIVPIRDKVLTFASEDTKYATEFNEVLAQSKIIP